MNNLSDLQYKLFGDLIELSGSKIYVPGKGLMTSISLFFDDIKGIQHHTRSSSGNEQRLVMWYDLNGIGMMMFSVPREEEATHLIDWYKARSLDAGIELQDYTAGPTRAVEPKI